MRRIPLLFLLALLIWSGLSFGANTTNLIDVTSQIQVTKSGLELNRFTNTFNTTLTLTNTVQPLYTALTISVTRLPSGVTLYGATGTDSNGNPTIQVSLPRGILSVGGTSSNVLLQFKNPGQIKFTYSTQFFGITSQPVVGTLLQGNATALATTAITNYSSGLLTSSALISQNSLGTANYIRNIIEIIINPNATIGQINSILNNFGALIYSSNLGSLKILIQIPDPGTVSEQFQIVNQLLSYSNIIDVATPLAIVQTNQLPGGAITPEIVTQNNIAVRGYAAWNAINAIGYPKSQLATLWVPDEFGKGGPFYDQAISDQTGIVNNLSIFDITRDGCLNKPSGHGYNVTGIFAGLFNSISSFSSYSVSGILPATSADFPGQFFDSSLSMDSACLRNSAWYALADYFPETMFLNELLYNTILPPNCTNIIGNTQNTPSCPHIIINGSWGKNGKSNFVDPYAGICPDYWYTSPASVDSCLNNAALNLLRKVRPNNILVPGTLEKQFIFVNSAGNYAAGQAANNTDFAAAALLNPITTIITDQTETVAPLTNTLVVESRSISNINDPQSSSISVFSTAGGNISAIGEGVPPSTCDGNVTNSDCVVSFSVTFHAIQGNTSHPI
ncbi:MAG: hypothetical protein ABSB19_18175 [Methylomonas sp.]|jgi:hypothetical protein